jgi:hypothetical protein
MVDTDDPSGLLQKTLARRVQNFDQWLHCQQTFHGPKPGTDVWAEYPPQAQPGEQHLVIEDTRRLRDTGAALTVLIEWLQSL